MHSMERAPHKGAVFTSFFGLCVFFVHSTFASYYVRNSLPRFKMLENSILRFEQPTVTLQQMKKMAEKRSRWIDLGHGEYYEIPAEKDFFSIVKANDRVCLPLLSRELALQGSGQALEFIGKAAYRDTFRKNQCREKSILV